MYPSDFKDELEERQAYEREQREAHKFLVFIAILGAILVAAALYYKIQITG